jgi:transcriptional regulator with XRE-family HTH domain
MTATMELTGADPAVDDLDIEMRVGLRLREIRKSRRLSLSEVYNTSDHNFKASVLGSWERGERAISLSRLRQLCTFYGVTLESVLAPTLGNHVAVMYSGEMAALREFRDIVRRINELAEAHPRLFGDNA